MRQRGLRTDPAPDTCIFGRFRDSLSPNTGACGVATANVPMFDALPWLVSCFVLGCFNIGLRASTGRTGSSNRPWL